MSLISVLRKTNHKTLFTTPSHGGKISIMHKFYQWYRADISEVDAYNPEDALEKAEKRASEIYGTKSTSFLTNGSSSGIIASTLACCKQNDKLLIWNNAHPSHRNAGKLAGAKIVEYELPFNTEWGVFEGLNNVEQLLDKYLPKAIIVTSPSYEGFISDIPAISKSCKKRGVFLIVDEAHGALYPFSDRLPETSIPYADFTIQSLHKTAGGINPTALLHSNCELDIKSALSLITTTSPSYPMLATIEANINYLNSKKGKKNIELLIDRILDLRKISQKIEFGGNDITKILIKKNGLSGAKLSEILFDKYNIEDERTNDVSTMLLTGIGTTKADLIKLAQALKSI